MEMETFNSRYPKIAEKETRIVKVQNPTWGIEPGHYMFLELFCNDDTCDCRRAMIHVVDIDNNHYAYINYGWENLEFYTKFLYGDIENAESLVGAQLLLDQPQSDDANKFLNLFISMIQNPTYANRIQAHYNLFKNIKQKNTVKNIDPVDSWIFHREEANSIIDDKTEFCNVFVLLDGDTGYCFGEVVCNNLPSKNNILELLEKARIENKGWPKQIFISKKDLYLENFQSICEELKIKMVELTPKDIKPLVKDFTESFYHSEQVTGKPRREPRSEKHQRMLDEFIPDAYAPCACASGKKFKFCCKKIFMDTVSAQYAALDGLLPKALEHMKEAELKMGTTLEILYCYSLCWAYFDKEKELKYLDDAYKLNPNHPKTNFSLGNEALNIKDFEKAISYFQTAVDNFPKEAARDLNKTYNNIGVAYMELNKFQEAKDAWEKALIIYPNDAMAMNNLHKGIYENPEIPDEIRGITPFMKKFLKREGWGK